MKYYKSIEEFAANPNRMNFYKAYLIIDGVRKESNILRKELDFMTATMMLDLKVYKSWLSKILEEHKASIKPNSEISVRLKAGTSPVNSIPIKLDQYKLNLGFYETV